MERLKKLFFQGLRFSMVGAVNSLIDWGVFNLLTLMPFFDRYYPLANAISYSMGVINSLYMNKRFTFREKEPMGAKRVALFLLVNLVSFAVSTLTLYVARDVLLWGNMVSKLAAVVFALGVNFSLNKLLVFKG